MNIIHKLRTLGFTLLLSAAALSCSEQLDVENPNQPSPDAIKTETGLISFGLGIYKSGFLGGTNLGIKYYDGVPGHFWSGAIGNHELMADVIGTDIANIFINQIGCPDKVTFDNGTTLLNPNSPNKQVDFIRITSNLNSTAGQNSLYFEWAYMYSLNNACNTILATVDEVEFTGDAETKKNVLKAWARWWKGFAYSRIGSMYYAGLIVDEPNGEVINGTNGNYVAKEAVIAEANRNLDEAASILGSLTQNADYNSTLTGLIPSFNLVGKGGLLTPAMWIRTINTLKARNILVNSRLVAMTATQWDQILALTSEGVTSSDFVFTGRSNTTADFLDPTTGTVSLKATGPNNTYKITERLVQDFKGGELTADLRFKNNVKLRVNAQGGVTPYIGEVSRGNSFFTRWELINRATTPGLASVIQWSNQSAGGYELFMASSYEENALMRAEALIFKGSVDEGLTLIDQVRTAQGAGLAAVSGTGLTQEQAIAELKSERRIGLVFRALSYYDARRWGILDPLASGGGRTGAVALDRTGTVFRNTTIEYNFLDYWDVPDNELAYNPPAEGSAPTTNPR
ncbi:RagB/SusD family nutrient uptake outer membrane protein [Chryseolinea sp. T2]|uniref:RagB/SusD family nutrient uptake outer membrane protein n=1 Tax=Chryseolinea sp. T2 TaxID=3129255 RepID=UPI003077C37D